MSKSKTSPIPFEMFKEFEDRLRKKGFIGENQRLSSLGIESFTPLSTHGHESPGFTEGVLTAEVNCKRWIYVTERVWDEERKTYIKVRVKTCIN